MSSTFQIQNILTTLFVSISISVCSSSMLSAVPPANQDLDSLLKWAEGTFSNDIQARVDSTYRHITITSTRIWKSRASGGWFYVVATTNDSSSGKIIFKYIYNIKNVEEGMFEVVIYSMKNDLAATDPTSLEIEKISADQLIQRRGCELYLQAADLNFIGSTHGTACAGLMQGSSYSTTEIVLSPRGLWWWERIYGPGGELVGGPPKGAYALLRHDEG